MKRIRRRIIGGQYKSAKSKGSYAIDLNGQWQLSTTAPNPDPTMYEGVYESFKNRGKNYSADLMYIDIDGLTEFSFYVRSYAEATYDFVVVSNLDCSLTSGTTSGTNVKLTTSGKQNSGTSISNYTLVEFPNIDGGAHRITVMYRKDSSQSKNDDRGYVLIPKLASLPEAHSYLTVEYQPTSEGETRLYEADLFDTTQLVSVEIDGVYYPNSPNTFSFSDTSTTHTVRFGFHENLTNCTYMFYNCADITKIDASEWDSSKVTDMSYMFSYAGTNATTGIQLNPSEWNVSSVTNMSSMFSYAPLGTTDFSSWGNQVSNVTNMSRMFASQTNPDITFGVWNCSNLLNMSDLFVDSKFTSLDLSNWNVSNVENMGYMFRSCSALTSINLSGWNTQNVKNIDSLFSNCKQLSQIQGISEWNVLNVTDMDYTFAYCNTLSDTVMDSLNTWDVHNVVTMRGLFESCSAITTTIALSNWDVSNVNIMTDMFNGCSGLTNISSISGWDTGLVNDMSQMFASCSSLTAIPTLNTSNVTNMSGMFKDSGVSPLGLAPFMQSDFSKLTNASNMFRGCNSLDNLNVLNNMNFSNITNMEGMFSNCTGLTTIATQDLTWDTSKVTNMMCLFMGCNALTDISALKDLKLNSVKSLQQMFDGCTSLTNIEALSNWDVSNIGVMSHLFKNCTGLSNIEPLRNWNMSKVVSIVYMFDGCTSLTNIDALSDWDMGNMERIAGLFARCSGLTDVSILYNNLSLNKIDGLDSIFEGCSSLQQIQVGPWDANSQERYLSVNYMFSGCTNLTNVSMELAFADSVLSAPTKMFAGITTTGTLYYPASLQAKYEQHVIPYLPSTWTAIAQ